MPDAELYRATTDHMYYPHGPDAAVPVRAGQIARAGHAVIKAAEHLWVPLWVDYEVEQPKAKATTRKASGD